MARHGQKTTHNQPHFHCPENDDFYQSGQYKTLDTEEQEIRLLKALKPDESDPEGPLRFTLHQNTPLSKCNAEDGPGSSPFIAMSYRAGDPTDTVPVIVDGRTFNVFKSLGLALGSLLQSLCKQDGSWELAETLFIWADQICINQSDMDEKATQVRMMCQIYESCAWAYSWLGTSPQITLGLRGVQMIDHVQKIIENHYEEKGVPWENVRYDAEAKVVWTSACLDKLEEMGVDWAAVDEFFRSEYWFRGWICQELTVSPDVTFNTDEAEADRAMLKGALRFLETVGLMIRWHFDVEPTGGLTPKDRDMYDMTDLVPKVQRLSWLYKMDIGPFKFIFEGSEDWAETRGYTLDRLLPVARYSEVTDPLDKVYAYLGLALPEYDIVPDYGMTQTRADVFTQAACAYIKLHSSLDILSFAEEKTDDMSRELPSWVADWSIKQRPMSFWYRVRTEPEATNASQSIPYEGVIYSHDGKPDRVLGVPAITVDWLDGSPNLGGGTVDSYGSWEECITSWAKIAGVRIDTGSCETNDAPYQPQLDGDLTLALAFWSTVYRGVAKADTLRQLWDRKPSASDGKEGQHPSAKASSKESAEENTSGLAGLHVAEQHLAMCYAVDRGYLTRAGWRFVHSRSGYFGLTRARVETGDKIMVLLGADMPFLLRPYLDGYKLLGEVYVQGIMHGELLDKLKGADDDLVTESIRIY
ncbi:heterokaryon incompatibility protein-domain-containing protein [Apodospora peruviana]|uniref:Heterokaryon incompatibility protein-domain-containing protein n=1 Tax=Apodospora peruviana TaxID=516989 RepID=A0AAE0I049_9PEZI|nr:heterokaryon incompatibility protein-domain-containing protein [Apodospora peruviana]